MTAVIEKEKGDDRGLPITVLEAPGVTTRQIRTLLAVITARENERIATLAEGMTGNGIGTAATVGEETMMTVRRDAREIGIYLMRGLGVRAETETGTVSGTAAIGGIGGGLRLLRGRGSPPPI